MKENAFLEVTKELRYIKNQLEAQTQKYGLRRDEVTSALEQKVAALESQIQTLKHEKECDGKEHDQTVRNLVFEYSKKWQNEVQKLEHDLTQGQEKLSVVLQKNLYLQEQQKDAQDKIA